MIRPPFFIIFKNYMIAQIIFRFGGSENLFHKFCKICIGTSAQANDLLCALNRQILKRLIPSHPIINGSVRHLKFIKTARVIIAK